MAALKTHEKIEIFDQTTSLNTNSLSQIISAVFRDFIKWWYVVQPISFLKKYVRVIDIVDDRFSTSFLIRTFFIPWHRDNSFVGYAVGIIARLIFIPLGLFLITSITVGYLAALIFWIFIPVISLVMFIISPLVSY